MLMHGRLNKDLIRQRFARRLPGYRRYAIIQERMAVELADLISPGKSGGSFRKVLEIGAGSGAFTEAFLRRCSVERYIANDLVAECGSVVGDIARKHDVKTFDFIGGDIEEQKYLPENLDLVVSNATLQWLADIPALFQKLSACLRPGGMLAFSTFGKRNMLEIDSIEQVSLAYYDLEELKTFAREWFMPVECREEVRKLYFRSPEEVLRHISRTGVNGLVQRRPWTKSRHSRFVERYRSSFSSHTGVHLTYHPLFCVFRRKGGSS